MKNIIKRFKKPILLKQNRPGKYIPSGNIVNTGPLRFCTGIVIYNRKRREAYACHFSHFDITSCSLDDNINNEPLFKNILRESISKFGGPKDLEVFLAGCGEDNGDNKQKEEILSRIKESGFSSSNIVHRWNPNRDFWSYIEFDVDTGKNKYVLYREHKDIYI